MSTALPSYVTPEYLASLHLRNGVGTGNPGDRCAMQEVRAWLDLDPSKDEIPECVARSLGCFVIRLNDAHPIARELLTPHLPKLLGTRGRVDERKIAFRMADMAVRVWAADELAARGRNVDADKLRACAPVVNAETARAASKVASAADASAAAAAAYASAAYAADADADAASVYAYYAAASAYYAAASAAAYTYAAYAADADARKRIYTQAVALLVECCEVQS